MNQMKKYLGYIVLSVASAIYILYNFSVTSAFIYANPSARLHLGDTFIAEVLTFLPIAVFFIGLLTLSKKDRTLFERFNLRSAGFHLLLLLVFIGVHSSWQVFINSKILTATFNTASIGNDILYFLNMRVMIYVIMGGLVLGIDKIQERENYELKESELKLSLQKEKLRQIEFKLNPEIIYPVLNYIRKNAREKPEKASKLVLNLSRQLRILIDNLDEERIPINKDIEFYNCYFKSVELRLEREMQVKAEVRAEYLQKKIPPLILLVPFLEKLFFGIYAPFTRALDSVTYKSHEAREGNIGLRLEFYPLVESQRFEEMLQGDSELEGLRNFLTHFDRSLFETHIAGDTLSMQLNFYLLYELDVQTV